MRTILLTVVGGLSQAGLALTPPATPSASGGAGAPSALASVDDGLLDASEVARLKVASRATVFLTTGMFGAYAREPALGRAGALRRSQLALARERDTSHRFFWAPFVLVGDGGGWSVPRP